VHSGALEVRAVDGAPAIAYAGEFLHSALPSGVHDGELRASTTAFARVFRISLHRQEASLVRASARTRFTAAQRRNKICVAASPDARAGSLKTNHDVIVCSSILDVGHHLAYPVGPRRTVWMHVVDGSAEVGELVLREGDSVGVYDEPWVSCVAQCSSEVLLIDIGPEDSVGHHNDVDLSF
jgi:redox-sensitive bicupin YhaK (pirin superfamily)